MNKCNLMNRKSTKLLFSVGLTTLTSVYLMFSYIGEETWKDVIMSVFSIFMLGHVGQKIGMGFVDKNNNGIPDHLESETKKKNKKDVALVTDKQSDEDR